MSKKKICFIAQFPPPIHGLSKAVDTLYNSSLNEEFDFQKVDITDNKKIFINLVKIFKSNADLFYFTISQTKGGNLRDLIILKLLKIQHKKCIVHLHGGYYRQLVENDLPKWQKKANYKAIKNVDGAIVLGNSLKYIFEGMIDNNKIFIVPNCVDDEFLMTKQEFDEKLKNNQNKPVKDVLYLSNFIKEKGYEHVLELAKLTKEEYDKSGVKKFHFHFAGKFFNENEEKEFFDYIEKKQLKEFVTYYGIVTGNEKKELLKKCDLFVLLTTYPKEGQPISILEAMENGMVIIATNHAGISDIVKSDKLYNKNCLIKSVYDDMCIFNEQDYHRKIIINKEIIEREYTKDVYINNLKRIFMEAFGL